MDKKKRGRQPGAQRTIWPDERVSLLRKLYPEKDNAELSKIFNVSERAIRSAAIAYGVKKAGHYWPDEDRKWLLEHWGAVGYGFEEIQAHFPAKTKWAIINKYRSLTGKRIDNGKAKTPTVEIGIK